MKTVNNFTTKKITEFTTDDTIYITRTVNKYTYHYFCKFNRFEKGMVYGNIIDIVPDWAMHKSIANTVVSARLKKCYVFGRQENDRITWDYCHWFESTGYIKN